MKQAFLTGKRSNLFLILVVLGLLFGMAWQAKAAESHNMTTEFSSSSNPNGVWTYGTYTGGLDKSTFTAFAGHFDLPADLNTVTPQCSPPNSGGFLEGWRDVVDPNVIKNTGATHVCPGFGTITFHAGAVTFGPAPGPESRFGAVVRFTVPSAGDWQVDATFATVQDGNPSPMAWFHDGTSGNTNFDLVASPVPAFPTTASYNPLLTGLPAGATIDIVVGNGSKTTEVTATITKQYVNVGIDIKPGSDPNSINCNRLMGVTTVAILTTGSFDALTVDHTTVTFEGASETHIDGKTGEPRLHAEDVDGDGDTDLVFHFLFNETALECESTIGTLTGELFDGTLIEGEDAVRMIERGNS